MKKLLCFAAMAASLLLTSCSDEPDNNRQPVIDPVEDNQGLFVVNSGNYGYGNASLSFIETATSTVKNNLFYTANDMLLGDVAQSMSLGGGKGWVVVNNSNVIFAIDPLTCKELGRIDAGITSPRNFYYVNKDKAYVTQMYDNRIAIVDPSKYKVTGYIDIPEMEASTGSTEQMVFDGRYAYVNCWSYQKNIVKIDTTTDKVVKSLEVGIQPESMALDANGMLWVLNDGGGWDGNPVGYVAPTLVKVDPVNMVILSTFTMDLGDSVSALQANNDGTRLYWINAGVYEMSFNATALPAEPIIATTSYLNALAVSPIDGDLFVADALDYQQSGVVSRYRNGELTTTYNVGIIPTGFCWLTE